jgi:hypothetical protein
MSTPRDRDGFEDRPDEGSGWQEPAHLGGGSPGDGAVPDQSVPDQSADGPAEPPSDAADRASWQPPGWDLPAAGDERTGPGPGGPGAPVPVRGGQRGAFGEVFTYQGDLVGAQGWALQHGWTITDGGAPEDAVLADLIATAPVRPTRDHRPGGVMRGRYGTLEIVAFDVVYASGRYVVPQWAVTAVPMLGAVPAFRLSPARFWKHRTTGLVPVASGNEEFDTRWLLLAAQDDPQVRRLVQDPAVQGLLLGSDDGDELWSGAGHVAAVRPDGHRPELIEHHARLLTAIVGALTAGY